MHKILTLSLTSVLILTGCDSLSSPQIYPPTPNYDYSIKVVPTANGMAAVPPSCPDWATNVADPFDNQPLPQFGCANARNLALMIDQPQDLIKGRDMGNGRATTTVGAIRRYDNNQTRGLIYPSKDTDTGIDVTTAPTTSSSMTGEITGGGAAPASAASGP